MRVTKALSIMKSPVFWIMTLAVILRLWALDVKPPHFDEGVNGWFVDQMIQQGFYRYDPSNYHGPLYFYFLLLSEMLLGFNLWALRLPAVLCSLAAVWWMFKFEAFIGRQGSYIAALAMATSPAYVFYGRYSIHESSFVLFSILALWGLLSLWREGGKAGLYALIIGLAGLFLTKETYLIQIGCMLLAIPCLKFWERFFPSTDRAELAVQKWQGSQAAIAGGVALAVLLLFYSGFGMHWEGIKGFFSTLLAWTKTGLEGTAHTKPEHQIGSFGFLNYYWLMLMARYEWPALAGLLACFFLLRPAPAVVRYMAILGAGLLLAYSIIPYKTPWCILSIIWPFYLVLGAVADQARLRLAVPGAYFISLATLVPAVRVSFLEFDNDKEPYVYVQTYRDVANLLDPLQEARRHSPALRHEPGFILVESYYPLPWLLRDFPQTGYYKPGEWPEQIDGLFVLVEEKKEAELLPRLKGRYLRVPLRLRSGMEDCLAYLRWEEFSDFVDAEVVEGGAKR